eukprot:scaffold1497_cov122-Cylindrotheca_fusiformis.AAC.3
MSHIRERRLVNLQRWNKSGQTMDQNDETRVVSCCGGVVPNVYQETDRNSIVASAVDHVSQILRRETSSKVILLIDRTIGPSPGIMRHVVIILGVCGEPNGHTERIWRNIRLRLWRSGLLWISSSSGACSSGLRLLHGWDGRGRPETPALSEFCSQIPKKQNLTTVGRSGGDSLPSFDWLPGCSVVVRLRSSCCMKGWQKTREGLVGLSAWRVTVGHGE